MSDWDDWEDHNAAVAAGEEEAAEQRHRDELAVTQHLEDLEASERATDPR